MNNYTKNQLEYWHDKKHGKRRTPDHPIVKLYVCSKIEFICTLIELGKNILDVGAGNGYFSKHFNDIVPTTAIDYSSVMLKENPVPDKKVMDACLLDLPDKSFDTVFCHAVLHHIAPSDQPKVIQEMSRVARRQIVIIEPNRNNPIMAAFGILKKEERESLKFSKNYLKKLVENSGISVTYACSYGLLTPNRMPIPKCVLPVFKFFERPLPLGVTNIIIARVS